MKNITCVVPAAGLSTRMGDWKMTLPWKNGTIISTVVGQALEYCQRIILITGYRSDELTELFKGNDRVHTVYNDRYQEGQFSSLIAGLQHVQTDRLFLTLGDLPFLTSSVYAALDRFLDRHPECPGVFPNWKGKNGHPVLLKKKVIEPLLKIRNGSVSFNTDPDGQLTHLKISSMKEYLSHWDLGVMVTEDSSVCRDLDTPEDYFIP